MGYDFHKFRIENESSSSLQRLVNHGIAKNVSMGDLTRLEGTTNIGKQFLLILNTDGKEE